MLYSESRKFLRRYAHLHNLSILQAPQFMISVNSKKYRQTEYSYDRREIFHVPNRKFTYWEPFKLKQFFSSYLAESIDWKKKNTNNDNTDILALLMKGSLRASVYLEERLTRAWTCRHRLGAYCSITALCVSCAPMLFSLSLGVSPLPRANISIYSRQESSIHSITGRLSHLRGKINSVAEITIWIAIFFSLDTSTQKRVNFGIEMIVENVESLTLSKYAVLILLGVLFTSHYLNFPLVVIPPPFIFVFSLAISSLVMFASLVCAQRVMSLVDVITV